MSALVLACALLGSFLALTPTTAGAVEPDGDGLYLVTLTGPGVSGDRSRRTDGGVRVALRARQDATLAGLDTEPVYRWTEALNGYAVQLTTQQAQQLAADERVALVERETLRPLAAPVSTLDPDGPRTAYSTGRGGQGVVLGVVDSGVWPESPLFAGYRGLGRVPRAFRGECAVGAGIECSRKIVAARWFVDGFGRDRVRSTASLSARDDTGHGTQVASLAVGNARVSARASGEPLGTYSGVAPQARLAVYKACWTAPDPADDGCSTADLVTAIDAATHDGVDVLNLSVAGSDGVDTVARALLGAAEADVVVVGAGGNKGDREYAAHPVPWVTTVGAADGVLPRGSVRIPGGPRTDGAMVSDRTVGPARILMAARATAPGAVRADAAVCRPGSLDAGRVRGAIVVCARGEIGRVDKSVAVRRAGGAGMVLVDVTGRPVGVDVHAVPTIQLAGAESRALTEWLARHRAAEARLVPGEARPGGTRVLRWSSAGDPTGLVVKPDLVAPGQGLLGATPPLDGNRFGFLTGSSGAAAQVSGLAARLRGEHRRWSATDVRSAISTSSAPVSASVLRQGAGHVSPLASTRPGLLLPVGERDYRRVLDGGLGVESLNTPSILTYGAGSLTRTVRNAGPRAMYFSSSAIGFSGYGVQVTPAALRLAPGEAATFRVRITRRPGASPADEGYVVWRGANGTRVRIPLVLSR